MSEQYIPDAHTPEQHLSNCQFQLENVQGWMKNGHRDLALAKAKCLLNSAELLIAEFEAEARAKGKVVA